ncbi:MAG: NADH-quinone oxidoreductase subunit NuoK [Candidatus Hodarchaeota archaeon]
MSLNIDPSIFIGIAILLFLIGFAGFIKSQSAVRMLIAIEIMINSANINFAIFALYNDATFIVGQVAVIISVALAAAEAAVGLGIILAVYRSHGTLDATDFVELKG